MRIYSYKPGESRNAVVFMYGNLIHRAIMAKKNYPDLDIEICFAVYKMARDVWVGFKPGTSGYGKVMGKSFGGDSADKLIYLLVQAARAKVRVSFVYHNPVKADDNKESPEYGIAAYLEKFKDDKTVREYLSVYRANWPHGATSGQMHNKFLLVNVYAGDQKDTEGRNRLHEENVYVATANVDPHRGSAPKHRWVQSGVLVSNNRGLYRAYRNYFDMITANTNAIWLKKPASGKDLQRSFHRTVRNAHKNNRLNYDDGVFRACFFPLPTKNSWDPAYNPVAGLTDMLIRRESPKKYLKINMYHLKFDKFGEKFFNALGRVKGFMNIKAAVKKGKNTEKHFKRLDHRLKFNAPTHAKNYTFAFSGKDSGEYFTVTGSTNAKWDAYCSKANNQLVIKETTRAHPVYSEFKKIFQAAYR